MRQRVFNKSLLPFLVLVAAVVLTFVLGARVVPPTMGGLIGAGLGVAWVALGVALEKKDGVRWVAGGIGAILGVFAGGLSSLLVTSIAGQAAVWSGFAFIAFPYIGFIAAGQMNAFPFSSAQFGSAPPSTAVPHSKILDTNVLIDGRIADVAQTGFLEGPYIIPQFILKELQYIADAGDSLRRVRGRRGLDILKRLQKMPDLDVRIVDDDFPQIRDVDSKIVALGKRLSAKIITNDFNLNKVAEIQGVPVLNLNQLTNALKPIVLPGEQINLLVVKEGKEMNQGVGYMEDGTMIVVDDGRKWIGKSIDVIVSSVLQTTAGRMIFTRVREREGAEVYPMAKSG